MELYYYRHLDETTWYISKGDERWVVVDHRGYAMVFDNITDLICANWYFNATTPYRATNHTLWASAENKEDLLKIARENFPEYFI